jgi:hypothetical protein
MNGPAGGSTDAPAMRICGTGTLSDVLGDAIAYRSLEPVDRRIPGLTSLRQPLGIHPKRVPRKVEPAYGRVVAEMLRAAGDVTTGFAGIDRVVLIGDTEHNDGGAFLNICKALGCGGDAFICDERAGEPELVPLDRG